MRRKRKILLYTHALTGGGAERVWALLASGLTARGHDVLLVVDFDAPDSFRAFARYDAARIEAAGADPAALLGAGHLAFTVDQGDATRYQGVVALTGQGLEAAAHEYFRQSEQIPTLVRLAVAQSFTSAGVAWRLSASDSVQW